MPLPFFTLSQAAKETGKSKTTISRDIKKGKLSAIKKDDGTYEIQAAELFRIYPKVKNSLDEFSPNFELLNKIEILNLQLKFRDDKIIALEKTNEDLKEDRNQWRYQASHYLSNETHRNKRSFWPWKN
jgi:hypothetical protein